MCDVCHHDPCLIEAMAEAALPPTPAKRCAYWIEKRGKGKRYVYSRSQCKNKTHHDSGYCHWHRLSDERRWG